jgi:hypothetical protein
VRPSNEPPPWYGNPELEQRSPKVERVPSQAPRDAAPGQPAQKPPKPVTVPADATTPGLAAQRKQLLAELAATLGRRQGEINPEEIKRRFEAYAAVSAALDKADPDGAAARRAETQAVLGNTARPPK